MSSHIESCAQNHARNAGAGHRDYHPSWAAVIDLVCRFKADQRGNILIPAAILLPVLAGAVGAAVVFSNGSATRTNMQGSLDAAVLAGAKLPDTATASGTIAAANDVFRSNLSRFSLANAKDISASFSVNGSTVSGVASGSVDNPFGGLIGPPKVAAKVNSAATKMTTPLCVLGLNGLENGSFDINGSKAKFSATCAVQANTKSGTGMTMEGQPTAIAKKFGVTGGHKGDYFSPPPADGSAKVADPYASVPFPYAEDCSSGKGKKGDNIKDDTTLSPGTYCGGIHIFGNATKVTLQPGIYVMVDGPFWVDASSVVTGEEVMIAFTGKGAAPQIWGDATVTLTSPTSGTYMNMQFMQDRDDLNSRGLWASIGGSAGSNAKLTYDGVAYFPTQNWWVFGNAIVNANSPSMVIVADKIWTQGSASVNVTNVNTRNLKVTVPQTSLGVRLIN